MNRTFIFLKKYYIRTILLFIACCVSNSISFGQCATSIVAARDTIACGESLILSNVGTGGTSSDDFSGGTLSGLWQSVTQGWTLGGPCGTNPQGGQHLWFANGSATPRTATTVGVDATCGGDICFDFRMETQSPPPCDGPDLPLEGVYLQYKAPAGAWTTINYFSPIGFPYVGWQNHCFPIPAAAQFNGTQFRWTQNQTSGPTWDQWGIDNVNIATCAGYSNLWSGPGVALNYTLDSLIVSPTSGPVDYFLMYSNWTSDTCGDTISIYVEQPTMTASLLSYTCTGSDTIGAQATIPSHCNYRFQLWNYLPGSPAGMHGGWTTGQPPPNNYHYLDISLNGSYTTSYTMQSGASTTASDFYLPVTDGDVIETTFINLGTGADECAYTVYNSLNAPVFVTGFPGSVPGPLSISLGNEIHASCPATSSYTYSWTNLTSGGTIGLSNPNIQYPLISVIVPTLFQVVSYDLLHPACTVTDTISVMANANPISATMNTTNTLICDGDDINLNFALLGIAPFDLLIDVNSTQFSYQLDAMGNNVITGLPITFTGVTTSTTFTIISMTDSTGCPASITNPVILVTVNNPPNAGNGPLNIVTYCESNPPIDLSIHISGSPDLGGTWTYVGSGISPANMPFTGLNYNFDPSSMPAGDYVYTASNPPCPDDATQITINLETPPYAGQLPLVPVDMCVGQILDLNSQFIVIPVPYTPTWTDITSGTPGTNILSNFSPPASGSYVLRNIIPSTANCPSDYEDINVIFHDIPTVSLSTIGQICFGEDVDLSFNLTGTAPFTITITDNINPSFNVQTDINGNDYVTGNTITVTPPNAGVVTYTVTAISDNFCSTSISGQNSIINVLTAPNSGALLSQLAVCSDDFTIYDLSNQLLGQDFNGFWIDANGIQQPLNSSFNYNISMPTGNYTYVVQSAVCPNSQTIVPVTIISAPNTGLANPQSICINDYGAGNLYNLDNLLSGSYDPGSWYQNGVAVSTNIDPNIYGSGITTFTYQANGIPPCINQSINVDLTINPEPVVNSFTSSAPSTTQGYTVDLIVDMLVGSPPFTIDLFDDEVPVNNSSIFIASGTTGQVTVTPNVQPTTTYFINLITDGNGCTTTYNGSVPVGVVPFPIINPFYTVTPEICEGSVATIEFDMIQGVPPVTIDYTLNGLSFTAILNSTGITSVVVDNINLNFGINTFSITSILDMNNVPAPNIPNDIQIIYNLNPSATFSTTTPDICYKDDAILEFDFLAGTPPFTVDYRDNGIPVIPLLIFNNLGTQTITLSPDPSVGNHSYDIINIVDSKGCIGTISTIEDILVRELPDLDITISGTNPICFGDVSELSFPVLSGLAPFNLSILEGSANNTLNVDVSGLIGGNPYQVSPATTTIYTLTSVTDAHGCMQSLSDSQTLIVNEIPVVDVSGTTDICEGDVTNISFDFSAGEADWTLSYDINGISQTPFPLSNASDIMVVSPTTTSIYTFTNVIDDNFCIANFTDGVTITVNQLPEVEVSGGGEICDDGSTVDVIFNTSGGTPTFNFEYTIGINTEFASNVGYQHVISTNKAGTYTVSNITDSKGCIGQSIIGSADVIVNPMPLADFNVYPQPADVTNPVINFVDNSTGHIAGTWDFDDNSTAPTNFGKLTHRFSDLDSGTYYVELYVESNKGCWSTQVQKIVIDKAFIFYIPNAFTPNKDMINDIFIPSIEGITEYDFYIYSRHGQEIFHTTDINEGWEGYVANGEEYAISGKYAYAIYIVDLHGKERKYIGDFLLIR